MKLYGTGDVSSCARIRWIHSKSFIVLPYATNQTGNYRWVDLDAGFASAGAWYTFAKNALNPFTLERSAAR
ncbi:MAG: hypothetical protein HN742_42530 [Lentisphaerae bacterium]|jgi:hypothetical protein|nr:hypothetical protein [Lentisphaerota bacterium]MBT4817453.1 hypothetical protein [Lentisphaerota bacterium]MBT5605390.1 hypothetical protein [Lentisphaerota bacterium]MBT7062014.1 hypothetical protein [Lentisphaerota bacterium]MBT7848616.1 hypothetical protein [Lentisphaerota bacterium]